MGAGAASWTHSVTGGYDVWYLDGTTQKFRYNLTNQQWWHYSTVGSSWYTISATGRPDTFIGAGSWFDIGNGFSEPIFVRVRQGYVQRRVRGSVLVQVFHGPVISQRRYPLMEGAGGRWTQRRLPGERVVIRSGKRVSNKYSIGSDKGTFKDDSAYRFLYNYASSQWYHTGDTLSWRALGVNGLDAAFVGNAHWNDLGNGSHVPVFSWLR